MSRLAGRWSPRQRLVPNGVPEHNVAALERSYARGQRTPNFPRLSTSDGGFTGIGRPCRARTEAMALPASPDLRSRGPYIAYTIVTVTKYTGAQGYWSPATRASPGRTIRSALDPGVAACWRISRRGVVVVQLRPDDGPCATTLSTWRPDAGSCAPTRHSRRPARSATAVSPRSDRAISRPVRRPAPGQRRSCEREAQTRVALARRARRSVYRLVGAAAQFGATSIRSDLSIGGNDVHSIPRRPQLELPGRWRRLALSPSRPGQKFRTDTTTREWGLLPCHQWRPTNGHGHQVALSNRRRHSESHRSQRHCAGRGFADVCLWSVRVHPVRIPGRLPAVGCLPPSP